MRRACERAISLVHSGFTRAIEKREQRRNRPLAIRRYREPIHQIGARDLPAPNEMNANVASRRARLASVALPLFIRQTEEPLPEVHVPDVTTLGTKVNGRWLPFQYIAPLPFRCHLGDMPAVGAKAFRKKNFAHLVKEVWGGRRADVALALEFKEAALVTRYMTTGKSSKPIGDPVARKMEVAARAAGADWVHDGWMDERHEPDEAPPPPARAGGTLEDRIRALPEPLRRYVVMELEICERVQQLAPTQFMRAPTVENRRAFQDYLHGILGQVTGKRNAA